MPARVLERVPARPTEQHRPQEFARMAARIHPCDDVSQLNETALRCFWSTSRERSLLIMNPTRLWKSAPLIVTELPSHGSTASTDLSCTGEIIAPTPPWSA